jgi:putative RNA 2'-phosphotransferase
MDAERLVKISKYLSKHLRHQPGRLGLSLAPGGWVEVEALLAACAAHNFPVTRAELDEVVARNDKQRYAFDSAGARIRANQGHSVDVDLGLVESVPPAVLFHGTGAGAVDLIREGGLRRMARHHVHLSLDPDSARRVGSRHGRPVVFAVDAAAMSADGHRFYVTANGVWLTDGVPPRYLRLA